MASRTNPFLLVLLAGLAFPAVLASLQSAAGDGDLAGVTAALQNGEEIDGFEGELTALTAAAQAGHYDVVEYLLLKNASIDLREKNKYTALMLAASEGHFDIVRLLVNSGADVTLVRAGNKDALFYAIQGQHLDIACFLAGFVSITGIDFQTLTDKCYGNGTEFSVGDEWCNGTNAVTCNSTCIVVAATGSSLLCVFDRCRLESEGGGVAVSAFKCPGPDPSSQKTQVLVV
ncbi:ankyrin repeat domain-containing protein 50-like [Penaeus monodon]|uniref:ankyrin repeat domain-containing protein 50-like n=1 Tax=Penaeus monodon TaxID=6687 RepID=UPI0018A72729|nr:ankyrin repeat domain-containing protein 50-like [Penaeus monodon]